MKDRPKVIVMAGPNGAGKSTVASELLPEQVEYINADEIAKTPSSHPSRETDIASARMVLVRMGDLEKKGADFAVETTLSGFSLAQRIERLRKHGYVCHLIFLWTPNAEFSIQRVASRVKAGGHHLPEDVIRRRHAAGMINFFKRYRPIVDKWDVYNSTFTVPTLVAEGRLNEVLNVTDTAVWDLMRRGGCDG